MMMSMYMCPNGSPSGVRPRLIEIAVLSCLRRRRLCRCPFRLEGKTANKLQINHEGNHEENHEGKTVQATTLPERSDG